MMQDVAFNGGLVHIIDEVLAPTENVTRTAERLKLTSLAGALVKADLVDAVSTAAGITIFAPRNEAFEAIESAVAGLSVEELSEILTYHVVAGTVAYSSLLKNGEKVKTLNGEELTITIDNGRVFVNGAEVVVADILTNNGVIHVIDKYVFPDSLCSRV